MTEIITEDEAFERYNDILDSEGPVTIAGIEFDPSRALRELDPIAYEVGFNDFVSSLTDDEIYVENYTDHEVEDDGQPDEAQEWESFDPDC